MIPSSIRLEWVDGQPVTCFWRTARSDGRPITETSGYSFFNRDACLAKTRCASLRWSMRTKVWSLLGRASRPYSPMFPSRLLMILQGHRMFDRTNPMTGVERVRYGLTDNLMRRFRGLIERLGTEAAPFTERQFVAMVSDEIGR